MAWNSQRSPEQLLGLTDEVQSLVTPPVRRSSANARSLNGCWTCRLRRKKCDEAAPSCLNCARLSLPCEGYGPKPAWLNGGTLERAKSTEVKAVVKETMKRRARRLSLNAQHTALPTPQTIVSFPSSSWSPSEVQFFQGIEPYSPDSVVDLTTSWNYFSNQVQTGYKEEGLGMMDLAPEFSSFCGNAMSEAMAISGDVISPTSITRVQSPVPSHSTSSASESINLQSSLRQPRSTSLSLQVASEQELFDGSRIALTKNQQIPGSYEEHISTRNDSQVKSHTADVFPANIHPLIKAFDSHEASLLMHYLDVIFYVQFPFYKSTTRKSCRGWLLKLLTEDRSVYHATLAFSHYHRTSKSPPRLSTLIEISQPSEEVNYYSLALSQLQHILGETNTWKGSKGLLHSIKVLGCILQFVFLEAFSNSSGNWSFHLKAADSLLPSLVDARSGSQNFISPENQEDEVPHSDNHLAVNFMLSAFSWLMVMARASVRVKLFSHFKVETLLQQGNLHLEYLFGCDDWVIALISRISQLDDWKRHCVQNRKLSVTELVRRGVQLEADLNNGLSDMIARRLVCEKATDAISECFSLAALTFLHVVVSGPRPDLPEIEDSVAKGTDVLTTLRDKNLMERVVWPVCVIGCMVSESKHDSFQSSFLGDVVTDMKTGTISQATEIVQCCWKERKEGQENSDWVSAMKSVGQHVLLL